MQQTVEHAMTDALDYLMTVVREGVRPEAAKAGLRALQQRHSEMRLQLVWEEEAFDQSIHYDALLSLPEKGTISMSYCDDAGKPWPLRGVQRWSDKDLVRVNNTVLQVDQAIACMDFMWDHARIIDQLVNTCLLQEELEENPINISDQELQLAMDRFRRSRGLMKAEDTYRWMERRGVSQQALERLVEGQAMIAKLRDNVVGARVEDYFATHSADFDTVHIARFLAPDEPTAVTLCEQIRRGQIDFFQEAQSRYIAAKQSGRPMVDLFTTLQRRQAPAEVRESLFRTDNGSLLGPVRETGGYAIIRVLSIGRATLDDATCDAIKNILFEEWLEQRRNTAAIEWIWGNASNTAQSIRTNMAGNVSEAG
jgi:putative peptide maturation system protein